MNSNDTETIAAQATPPGRGGVAIVRVSGPNAKSIAEKIIGRVPQPRRAHFCKFYDDDKNIIDEGLAIFFPGPNSFTGEDVLELQGHGGPVVMQRLLQRVTQLGARIAKPGEFSERAFLNDKIDLTQAEAIADLINADSEQAARCAMRSLQGDYSKTINELVEELIQLRMFIEAVNDFPDEEIDFIDNSDIEQRLKKLLIKIELVEKTTQQGALLQEGMTVVIAGKPNAGKSSLLNCLSGRDSAIVTEIAGTTRDVLREHIHIDGMPLHIIDTAGLRESNDIVEQEGMRRTWAAIKKADMILVVVDATVKHENEEELLKNMPKEIPVIIISNKIDLLNKKPEINNTNQKTEINLSAKTQAGVDLLKHYLKEFMGFNANTEGLFIARRRHLNAIAQAKQFITNGSSQLNSQQASELLAEDLRQAQQELNQITGEFTTDDLLGKIFSEFCIGK